MVRLKLNQNILQQASTKQGKNGTHFSQHARLPPFNRNRLLQEKQHALVVRILFALNPVTLQGPEATQLAAFRRRLWAPSLASRDSLREWQPLHSLKELRCASEMAAVHLFRTG